MSSGALLTVVLLMRAIDPLRHERATLEHLLKLQDVDPLRRAFYRDLTSKFRVENVIERGDVTASRHVDLSRLGLTTLYHLDQFSHVTSLDLSHNALTSLPPDLHYLQHLKKLVITGNELTVSLETIQEILPRLETLEA